MPPFLGYNKTLPIPEGKVLIKVKETGDPLVAVRTFGRGHVLAYMSDPAPHWGCNFIFWEEYAPSGSTAWITSSAANRRDAYFSLAQHLLELGLLHHPLHLLELLEELVDLVRPAGRCPWRSSAGGCR